MFIYKTTNLINGKIYIGQHCGSKPSYIGSGKLLKLAIAKYGRNNFKREILEHCDNQAQLDEREIIWIARYDSTNKKIGYNIESGGAGVTIDTRVKLSKLNSGQKNPRYGKKLSEETKKKISKALKNPSEETRKKMSEAQKDREYSDVFRNKMAQINKGNPIVQLDLNYKLIEEFEYISMVRINGFCGSGVGACVRGNCKTYKNFVWMYKDEFESLSEKLKLKLSKSLKNELNRIRVNFKKQVSKRCKGRKLSKETRKKLSNGKPIIQLDLDYNFIKEFEYISMVKKDGFHRCAVFECIKGRRNKHKNFIWMYKDEYIEFLEKDKEKLSEQFIESKKQQKIKIAEARKKQIVQLTLNGVEIKVWKSATDAAEFGFSQACINGCCTGRYKTHKGFKWKYKK